MSADNGHGHQGQISLLKLGRSPVGRSFVGRFSEILPTKKCTDNCFVLWKEFEIFVVLDERHAKRTVVCWSGETEKEHFFWLVNQSYDRAIKTLC